MGFDRDAGYGDAVLSVLPKDQSVDQRRFFWLARILCGRADFYLAGFVRTVNLETPLFIADLYRHLHDRSLAVYEKKGWI